MVVLLTVITAANNCRRTRDTRGNQIHVSVEIFGVVSQGVLGGCWVDPLGLLCDCLGQQYESIATAARRKGKCVRKRGKRRSANLGVTCARLGDDLGGKLGQVQAQTSMCRAANEGSQGCDKVRDGSIGLEGVKSRWKEEGQGEIGQC